MRRLPTQLTLSSVKTVYMMPSSNISVTSNNTHLHYRSEKRFRHRIRTTEKDNYIKDTMRNHRRFARRTPKGGV